MTRLDRTELNGRITTYDDDGFELMDAKKQTQKITWDQLPPDAVINLHTRLMRKPAGDDWMKLAQKLLTMPGGRPAAERAWGNALRLDPKLKDQVAQARKDAKALPPTTQPLPPGSTTIAPDGTATTRAGNPFDPRDPQKRVVGPQKEGDADPSAWGKLSPQQQQAALASLRQFADAVGPAIGVKLTPYDTQYFLFYSDLSATEAQKWVGVLDRMYARLSQLFGIAAGENIWHGKALVFVFSREEDYMKFQAKIHHTIAAGTAGMCHTYGSGDVHIAFYRQPNDLDFAHVLVHESVHGFLHRYRSPIDVPSWANEGLAEAIATDMVPRKGISQSSVADARQDLQTRKSLDKFFDTDHIVAWQYPVARTLTEFMIQQNKKGYVDFINGIKDGAAWDEALQSKYGVNVEQLVNAYGNSMGVQGLKP